jgi:N-acetyl sugar amidotransferase
MKYCNKCVYPEIAVNLNIDKDGICSSCRTAEKFENFANNKFWDERKKMFERILNERLEKNSSNYDCVIPVSGGKDSYFQAHIICEMYNLKALLVTYHGNNYLPEGDYNRDMMRYHFNADHIVWGPSIKILKKLNRAVFELMGDMNWQNHCGIFSAPIQIAVKFKIPLIFWGEIAWDISGMYNPEDCVEFSARVRHEHGLRGYEYKDFINFRPKDFNEKDLIWSKYPSDKEIISSETKGLYIGNFFKWDANDHVKLVKDNYNWKEAEKPFERTYRKFSNLDDRYENGIHDLLKFIKFGYGRASDHASKDIRNNHINRSQGVEYVKKYDHVVSSDLDHWLNYVERDDDYFWSIADTFRDPRVWSVKNNMWVKDTIWGGEESFGKVRLSKKKIEEFNKKKLALKK